MCYGVVAKLQFVAQSLKAAQVFVMLVPSFSQYRTHGHDSRSGENGNNLSDSRSFRAP